MSTAAFQCAYCRNLSVGRIVVQDGWSAPSEEDFDAEYANVEWLPARLVERQFFDVPDSIAKTASEAYKCLSVDAYNAAVAMARAVIEATAKAKGVKSGRIGEKIDALAARGHIRKALAEEAHEARWAGNAAMHGDDIPQISGEDAADILAIMSSVLREVFQDPASLLRLAANRKMRREAGRGDDASATPTA